MIICGSTTNAQIGKMCEDCVCKSNCPGYKTYMTTIEKKKYESLGLAIRAVIESCFSETKEDIQDRAWHLIMELIYSNKNI